MNISLTKELESLVQKKVRSGMYHSASEVIREALRLLREHDQVRQVRLDELRKEIAIGVAEAERGEVGQWNMEATKREAKARWKARRK